MPDTLSPEARSERMARVRSRDTKLEISFRRALWSAGVRGWRCNVRSIVGCPDLVWKGRKIAVFLDSAWWHGHPSRWTPGRLPGAWDSKIQTNKARDARVNAELGKSGWTVIRFFDFELSSDLTRCISEVQRALAGPLGESRELTRQPSAWSTEKGSRTLSAR